MKGCGEAAFNSNQDENVRLSTILSTTSKKTCPLKKDQSMVTMANCVLYILLLKDDPVPNRKESQHRNKKTASKSESL